jgi:hypothetical protein
MNFPWVEMYQAALLEVHPEKLHRRIEAAEKAIHSRIEELGQSDASSLEEHYAMADALRALRVLTRTECPSPDPQKPAQAWSDQTS